MSIVRVMAIALGVVLLSCSPVEPGDPAEIGSQEGAVYDELGDDLFTLVVAPKLSEEQEERRASFEADPWTISLAVLRAVPDFENLLTEEGVVGLPLASETRLVGKGKEAEVQPSGILSWTGVLDQPLGSVSLAVEGNEMSGSVKGGIGSEAILYAIYPLGGGLHVAIRVDESQFPPE